MDRHAVPTRGGTWLALSAGLFLVLMLPGYNPAVAQAPARRRAPAPPKSAQQDAPIDITGYWVSLVTEDWRYRMTTAAKGDLASVPPNPEGIRVANAWDLAKDNASGNQCKAWGAAAVMREPTRLHITWGDENTLKIETDSGKQVRMLRFQPGTEPSGPRTWQGYSVADWVHAGPQPLPGLGNPGRAIRRVPGGSLHAITEHMRAGYLRKNGVPYSENAKLEEFFDTVSGYGEDLLVVTTVVTDPQYLLMPFITSTHFKKEPDGSKWNPTPCYTDPPRTTQAPRQLNQ